MNDKNSIFRKSSLDRVSSPEQLNDYIKVSQPSIWLILVAVALLLVGLVVWGVFGELTTVRDAVAVVEKGKAKCYMTPEAAEVLAVGQPVRLADVDGTVTGIDVTPTALSADFEAYTMYVGSFQSGDFVVSFTADIAAPDGVYPAKVIVESISPISFLLN